LSTEDIYRELILDYYRNPRNFGKLESYDIEAHDTNPLCGDEVDMQIKVGDGGRIQQIKFYGRGCAISQASASMLTELAKGKELEWVRGVSKEDVFKMLGNPELGPSRVKCALLGMKVLKTGVYGYLGAHYEEPDGSDPMV
jgi:nitrogen fixation NifU-like protein